jgi:putative FmdB family regulatory protein
MPMYDYACGACGHRFEVRQSMKDDALTECPECPGAIRRVIYAPAIVFKGSGFYKTDSRPSTDPATTPPVTAGADDKKADDKKKEGAAAPAAESKTTAESTAAAPKAAEPAKTPTAAAPSGDKR